MIPGKFEVTEETVDTLKLFWQAVMNGSKNTEKFRDFIKRNCDFCDMLMNEYKGKNILIVNHAANARVINYYFNGKPKGHYFRKAVAKNDENISYENL